MSIRMSIVFPIVVVSLLSGPPRAHAADPVSSSGSVAKEFICAVHVHTRTSGYGSYDLPELTRIARGYGIDAVFLSDNRTYTIQYGIPPLRHLFWMNDSRNSVMTLGAEEYISQVEAENVRQSDVLYIPGVEICPRFYWTGSILGGDLVCHDHQRNLIVLGTTEADVIEKIPEACGYLWPLNWGWIILTRILVALLLLSLVGMLTMPGILARFSPFNARDIRKSFFAGLILPLVVIMVVVNAVVAAMPAFRIYTQSGSVAHAQRVIDFLAEHDLVHYWAHTEEPDRQKFSLLGVPFKVSTEPYPEMLFLSQGYTGFGGVYEGSNTLAEPGSAWDRVLGEYTSGIRSRPVWCFGEMLYHREGQAGKELDNIETVVWAREKSQTALMESIRNGKFYARCNAGDQRLVLDEWRVTAEFPRRVLLRVLSRIEGERVTLRLVRNGEVISEREGVTPLELEFVDREWTGNESAYYRATISSRNGSRIVTNPLFVRRTTTPQ